jgi:hypothetical protein
MIPQPTKSIILSAVRDYQGVHCIQLKKKKVALLLQYADLIIIQLLYNLQINPEFWHSMRLKRGLYLIYAESFQADMVKVSIGEDSVTIKLEGAKSFFALKSKIVIPLDNIAKVSTEKIKPIWFPRMRLGTHLPGAFMVGTFWLKGDKTFLFVKDFSKCIPFHLKNHEYSSVIVQVYGDKEALASRIRNKI